MKNIFAYVIRVDNFNFAQCGPQVKNINCDGAKVVGMGWERPIYLHGNVLQEWQLSLESAKPSPDSIRVIIVDVNQPESHRYYIAVADNATSATFTDLCNACCGDTPTTPVYTPPVPITEDCPCIDANSNYNYVWPLPANPNGLNIVMWGSVNGAYMAPAPPASFANKAAILTWLNANVASWGTWGTTGNNITLVSTTSKCAGLSFDLLPQTFCLPGGGAVTVDSLVVQTNATGPVTATVVFPGGPITFDTTTMGSIQYMLQRLLQGDFLINPGPTNNLQYTGKQVPVKLQLAGVDVVAFTAGACQNVYNFAIPNNPSSYNYFITADTFNGVAGTPVPLVGGWATTGAMLTWLNANRSAYGTWTIVGSNLVLTSAGTYSAAVTIAVHA